MSKINKIRFRYIFWGAFVFFGFLTWGIVFLIFIIQANIDSQSYDYVMEILIPMILISFSLWGLEIFIAGLNKKCLEFSRFFDVMKGKIAKIGWYMVFSTLAIALILFIIDIWIDDWFDIPSKIIYTIGISLIGFLILGIYFFYGKSIWKIKTPLIDKILEEKEIKQEKNLDSSIESLMERDIDRLTIKRTTKTARINLNPNFSYAIALFLILIGLLINGLSIWMINRIITIAPDFVVLDIGLIFFGVGLFLLSLAIISLTVIGFDLHKRENYWKTTTFTPDAVTINFFLKMKKITIDYSEIENLELSIVGGSLRYRREHIPWDYALFLVIEKKGENKPRYYRMGKTKGIYDDVLHQYCDTILSQVKKFPIAFKKSQVKTYDNRSELEKKIPKILFISSAIAGFIAVALSFMEVFFLNFN